jgi:hypothetical protein
LEYLANPQSNFLSRDFFEGSLGARASRSFSRCLAEMTILEVS